ncbi:hypothetical protein CKF54_05960 [Psittacicella hinzii]|uniref:Uncharacterized protein n=1 Tax=Psittacicella hinzii TaxID=2028575 RepID=A0A3A1Y3F6_9GAMM|nr:hypothetical protein [Psittacicella hinzii]RIY31839.1 hypothetical protein CKF54_05960 [Psittacicella hinzii]
MEVSHLTLYLVAFCALIFILLTILLILWFKIVKKRVERQIALEKLEKEKQAQAEEYADKGVNYWRASDNK